MNYLINNVLIASDHAGFDLKASLMQHLQQTDIKIENLGTDSQESVDYPDIAYQLCRAMHDIPQCFGILICGSGIGMSIAANRFDYIRASLCYSIESAELARKHNNANVLVLGSRSTDDISATKIMDTFLSTPFDAGRHIKRVEKLSLNMM